jgi:hypothetical protein
MSAAHGWLVADERRGAVVEHHAPANHGRTGDALMAIDTNTVVQLPRKRRFQRSPAVRSTPSKRRLAQQHGAAVAVATVAVVLTGLSLHHLAAGIELVTRAPMWEAWAMAVGIDLGFIALEMSQLCAAAERVRREIARFTKPGIIGTLMGSAVMNGLAFGAQAEGWLIVPAVGLGLAIPALIYLLSRVAFSLATSR